MLYLVTYDLKESERNYSPLYEAIKKSCTSWWHYMESIWLIQTNTPINDYNNHLRQFIGNEDTLFIVNISGQPRQGWLPEKAWQWINEHET